MKIKQTAYIIIVLLLTNFTFAQVKFEAKVSKKQLGVNERLRIDFTMNADGDNFVPPSFKNFTVVGGPNTSVSNQWINGKRTFNKTYSYFLSPKAKGKFTIKQATIQIEGQIYKTFPITVQVTKAVKSTTNGYSAESVATDNIHLVAEVSKANPYLNEAITVVYKLYVSKNTGVNNWREKEIPRYNDFWSQNIEVKGINVKEGTYKGEPYRYVVLRKTVLYPQKTGQLKIEPLVLDISVEVPGNQRDIFGRLLTTTVPKTITAGSRTLNVKPLPENGKPADFKGAVGEFAFKVTTSKTALNASESLQAKVEVSGKGNLKLFELPTLTTPSSLEVYEPEHKENVSTTLSGMRGRITDTYTIVPQYKGKYPLPGLSFSYFDLKTETYKTITTNEVIIDVINGPTANVANSTNPNRAAPAKQTIAPQQNTFGFIQTKTTWQPIKTEPFFNSKAFWLLFLLPLLSIPIALFVRKKVQLRNADVAGNKVRKADRLAKKYLTTAKKALGDKTAFYVALEKALHNYLKAKLRIETTDFNKEKIQQLLSSKQVDASVVTQFIQLLESCELARYTPLTQVAMENDYNKAATTIGLIDKQIR